MTEPNNESNRRPDSKDVDDLWRNRREELRRHGGWFDPFSWPLGDFPYGFLSRPLWTESETRPDPGHDRDPKGDNLGLTVRRDGHFLQYCFDLPGMSKADVRVDLDDKGTLKVEAHHDEGHGGTRDLSYEVSVGGGVERKDVHASMSDGMLTVIIPDKPQGPEGDTSIEVA